MRCTAVLLTRPVWAGRKTFSFQCWLAGFTFEKVLSLHDVLRPVVTQAGLVLLQVQISVSTERLRRAMVGIKRGNSGVLMRPRPKQNP